jgi:3-oxoacyl-[acyl-carrier protein] reductase
MRGLTDKKALVTGGSRGIGREVALRLAAEGVAVAVNFNTGEAEAAAVVVEIEALGSNAIALKGSVASAADADSLVEETVAKLGGLDILVNNAGITRDNLLMRMSEEDWDAVLDTNLKGAFLCTKAAIRPMLRQKSGRIINMSSVVALTGNAGQANYTAAKAVAPGFIKTRMVEQLAEEFRVKVRERIPLARFGSTEDVAASVAFLASDDAAYITGQVLSVDGGLAL